MLVDFKNVGEFEEKSSGFVFFEAETKATSERVETRDGQGLAWLGKDERLEFEDFSGLFLHFHVVVETVVAYSVLFFRDRGGLGHELYGGERERRRASEFEETASVREEYQHCMRLIDSGIRVFELRQMTQILKLTKKKKKVSYLADSFQESLNQQPNVIWTRLDPK